jgi:hypothetical protein
MTDEVSPPGGPDLPNGLDLAQLADGGMLRGHVGPEAVLLVRAHDVVPPARAATGWAGRGGLRPLGQIS